MESSPLPRIGIVGCFDRNGFRATVLPLVYERELSRRLPAFSISVLSAPGRPHGAARGELAWSAPRSAREPGNSRRFDSLDLLVVLGDPATDKIVRDQIQNVSTIWCDAIVGLPLTEEVNQAAGCVLAEARYVSTSDAHVSRMLESSNRRVAVDWVPEPCLLAAELVSTEVIDLRLRQLRAMGAYPPRGRPVVVECPALLQVDVSGDVVVFVSCAEEQERAERFSSRATGRTFVIDPWATAEDVIAAISCASGFEGPSRSLRAVAAALGVPFLRGGGDDSADSLSIRAFDELRTNLAAHFDRAAAVLEHAGSRRRGEDPTRWYREELERKTEEIYDLSRAHAVLRERMVAERAMFAEALNREADGELNVAGIVERNAHLRRERMQLDSELTVSTQQLVAAEASIEKLEAGLEAAHRELEAARRERDAARALLSTRLVEAATRVQRWMRRARRK